MSEPSVEQSGAGDESPAIRPYAPGDEAGILALFREVFGVERSLAHWRWKFVENPYGDVHASLVDGPDGRLVAQYTVQPVRVYLLGRSVAACQSLDTMVHGSQRGRRLFERTARDAYARLEAAGFELVFGLPNQNSLPGFLRQLQWRRIGYLREYTLRVGCAKALGRRLPVPGLARLADAVWRVAARLRLGVQRRWAARGDASALALELGDRMPDGCEALCARVRAAEVASIWKDEAYFAWRYDAHPDRSFFYAALRGPDGLAAVAVVHPDPAEGQLLVCELLVAHRDVGAARRLLLELACHAARSGFDTLVFIGRDAGFFEAACADFRAETRLDLVFSGRVLSRGADLASVVHDADSWTITVGDTDLL